MDQKKTYTKEAESLQEVGLTHAHTMLTNNEQVS